MRDRSSHSVTTSRSTIRLARSSDVETIVDIWHRGWTEVHRGQVPPALEARRTRLDMRQAAESRVSDIYVATVGDAVVGFVASHDDEVEHLYVSPESRSTGAASRLLAEAEATIARGAPMGWLAVVSGNMLARTFYERRGWICRGRFNHTARVDSGTISLEAVRYEKGFWPTAAEDIRTFR